MTADLVTIDGSFGEGGGQILRTALALACITGTPFEIVNIRANRKPPGLRPQHLQCVTAAARITNARVTGAEIGSSRISFRPERTQAGDYAFDIGTAGSTSLVLQTIFYPLALADAPSTVAITGGTHVPFAPCFHYLEQQWRPCLLRMGFDFSLKMKKAGYYPEGGGRIAAAIAPTPRVQPLRLIERGEPKGVEGISAVSNLPNDIAARQARRAEKRLGRHDLPARMEIVDLPAHGKGTMLFLTARFQGSQACYFGLGARGKPAEKVADEACRDLVDFLGTDAAIDRFLADQILLPLALAQGASCFTTERVTQHLLTNVEVVKKFLPANVHIEGEIGEAGIVQIHGSGPTTQ